MRSVTAGEKMSRCSFFISSSNPAGGRRGSVLCTNPEPSPESSCCFDRLPVFHILDLGREDPAVFCLQQVVEKTCRLISALQPTSF